MKEYYSERFHWILRYTSKNIFYCLLKTLCLIIGLPIYVLCIAVEMILTFVNMIFSWIPVLGMVIGLICKAVIFALDKTFFICILTDIGKWKQSRKEKAEYEVADANEQSEQFCDDDEFSESVDNSAEYKD